ncbi:urease accessory protein UreE [uncultured Mycolicibacterium sp.]|uniref:urease accessory protein UreE n=1 Tax=uncultured Mycolicibacterium sp. TaxID=2320817 RepID=UPI00262BAE15|nr:urease accessory protein UreE [uncultured Mycolicibacterium sp.]
MTVRTGPRILDGIVGWATEAAVTDALHRLRHTGTVETIHLAAADLQRRRLRVVSDAGTDYAIALPRGSALADGAVLLLEPDRAVLVRAGTPRRMALRSNEIAAAIRLGLVAGHLHWKCDQHGDTLVVHLDGPEEQYRKPIAGLLADGRIELADTPPDG